MNNRHCHRQGESYSAANIADFFYLALFFKLYCIPCVYFDSIHFHAGITWMVNPSRRMVSS